MSDTLNDKAEGKLEQLAKKLLSMKPKPRQDMVGKGRKKKQKAQTPAPKGER